LKSEYFGKYNPLGGTINSRQDDRYILANEISSSDRPTLVGDISERVTKKLFGLGEGKVLDSVLFKIGVPMEELKSFEFSEPFYDSGRTSLPLEIKIERVGDEEGPSSYVFSVAYRDEEEAATWPEICVLCF